MNGKIDNTGKLWIKRAGKMISQQCPHCGKLACGDWCPMFGEPDKIAY